MLLIFRQKGIFQDIRRAPDTSRAAKRGAALKNQFPLLALSLAIFFFHSGAEAMLGTIISSYMHDQLGAAVRFSALSVTLVMGAVTFGRMMGGFLVVRLGTGRLIRIGLLTVLAGSAAAFLAGSSIPLVTCFFTLASAGIGPLFPCLMHETQQRFGEDISQHMVGFQIAAASIGTALVPLFSAIAFSRFGLSLLFPFLFFFFALVMVFNAALTAKLRTRAGA